jgi:hypothetical protein
VFRNIEIRAVLNGFITQVGCQTIVFPTIEQLAVALVEYGKDPARVEKEWLVKSVNSRIVGGPAVAEQAQEARAMDNQLRYAGESMPGNLGAGAYGGPVPPVPSKNY